MAARNKRGDSGLISHGTVAENRRARFDYEVLDTLEAGIMLTGTEVKALRNGEAQITESYVSPEGGELWLINATIPEYIQANRFNHDEKRRRKLLVSRKEMVRLAKGVERSGNTIVALKLYFNDRGLAKLLIGLAKGRKSFDKRNVLKDRDWARDKQRLLKQG
ncbi:SsrA-binding protein SmpB [Pelagibacterium montanilacus]|uniref:SsrA-binding protein SmpB n=1 Tax=Pelagibacterium montanilacus TaxID=2185280 RepID=UPI000F8D8EBD|nr:SsrA-binding protein SmpB [Pelagibacterium montanilacus]